jgi:hypothetical protein
MGCGNSVLGAGSFLSIGAVSCVLVWLVRKYGDSIERGQRSQMTSFEAGESGGVDRNRIDKWRFTKLLASIGFYFGGLLALAGGLYSAFPPPAPPGTVSCGTAALGGWMLILVSPLVALLFAALGGCYGLLVDSVRKR